MSQEISAEFLSLPREECASAALQRAGELGAEYADLRVAMTRSASLRLRDAIVEGTTDDASTGMSVRVLWQGCWGFAASDVVSVSEALVLAEKAVALARISSPLVTIRVELAPEPVHNGTWTSALEIDPFDVPAAERVALMADRSALLLAAPGVSHADAGLQFVRESTFFASAAGTRTIQQRTRIEAEWSATHVSDSGFESMSTTAPPVARGWEYVLGRGETVRGARPWDWNDEIAQLPLHLAEKVAAPSVVPGPTTLVIDPTNLWLTIHESVGHATELDRALGYEANYAGTSFATPEKLGTFQYGSPLMHIVGDRTADFGLATTGWDDEGVEAQTWDLVRDGILVGYQLDRSMAGEMRFPRSNGCAYADSAEHVAIQRMPNVSLMPEATQASIEDLIAGVDDGLYIVGDRSWSIDMQRYNFQFTGQRFHRIKSGRLAGQVKDVAYQSRTPDFWGSMVALGGPETYLLGGALNCGKGQPGQVAPVSHGCPAAVFEGVNVLNSAAEAGS